MRGYLTRLFLYAVFLLPFTELAADTQADRLAFIERLTNKGIFLSTGFEDGVPRLVVTPDFYESDLESKQTAVGIVYQYYVELDSAYDSLVIIDGTTGAQIGMYTADGLEL